MHGKMSGEEEYAFKVLMWLFGLLVERHESLKERLAATGKEKMYKTATTQLMHVMQAVASTVEPRSMEKIMKDIDNGRVYFRVDPMGKKAAEKAEEWTTASKRDLQIIFDAAGKAECTFCDKSRAEAEACLLRKAMRRYTYGDEGKDIDGCAYRGWDWQVED